MHFARLAILTLLLALSALAQSDRGTITGTISDPAGAVVAAAPVQARNVDTGAAYEAASSATGNYTLPELPTGNYELSVTVAGFKKYVRQNLFLPVAQTLRIDVSLQVGSNTESITVSEAAPLLKTESGELSHNVTSQSLDQLPVLGIGSAQASSSGVRNPLAVAALIPGTYFSGSANLTRVNGAQGNTNAIRIEGQDATNEYMPGFSQHTQPSVDAIQEISVQTSNFAAEFGQVGGGFFNFTMKSGNNQFHGSGYDYFVNEALNAGQPFTNNRTGGLLRNVQRRNDYGGTIGGPVWIPKIYDGHNKTFFFFNWEQFRETQNYSTVFVTVPTPAYRTGNFSAALTAVGNKVLGTDPLSRQIIQNTVYDPSTTRALGNGTLIRDPYTGNQVPPTAMDPISLKIQSFMPLPNAGSTGQLINNGLYPFLGSSITTLPALKIDHSISSKAKISGYWSSTKSERAVATGGNQGDGLPYPITEDKGFFIRSQTERINFDYTVTPTLLLHMGVGFLDHRSDTVGLVNDYNALTQLGLQGTPTVGTFPKIQGINNTYGGMKDIGANDGAIGRGVLPTASTSLTWVKDNHTFKAGAEMRLEGFVGIITTNSTGFFQFDGAPTGQPYLNTSSVGGGTIGMPYASFLLGSVSSLSITQPPDFRLSKQQWGFFLQDTWKVTRKLTLDYGLRYDYSTYLKEQYGRLLDFSPSVPNPTAGGILGAVIFEGDGPGHCGCNYAHNYPLALAPRLGAAYQINSKTVFRAGFGIVYTGTGDVDGTTGAFSVNNTFTNPQFGQPFMQMQNGVTVPFSQYSWPNFNPGQFPKGTSLTSPNVFYDQNAGRPARQYQWSAGIQREIFKDLALEASYVGNRGIWWNSPGLININSLTPQILANYGLSLSNSADLTILNSPLNTAAAGRFQNHVPYSGFPATATVAQSLRPYPQFGALTTWWSPLGKTWYDSLQAKATKRFGYGLSATWLFVWSKQLTMGSPNVPNTGTTGGSVNDVFNRSINKYISQYDQPLAMTISLSYTTPKTRGNKILSWAARDWTTGVYLQYSSGLPILAPTASNTLSLNNILFRPTFANRVPDVPLFMQDLNCHCIDPNKQFVLNPAAWVNPANGQFSSSAAYYSDYRYQRRPAENFNFGRTFRIREGMTLNVRAEFTNIFNRTEMANPVSTNAQAVQSTSATGQTTGGFGWISPSTVASPPRAGTIIGRFQF
jgi:carboxypeptidase family protein/TonB-dependent receptor-like protein